MKRFILILLPLLLIVLPMVIIGPRKLVGNFLISTLGDTEFGPGYSEKAFRQIGIGDSEASILTKLGPPLNTGTDEPFVSWLYAPDPHPDFATNGGYPDTRYSFTTIRFDEKGQFKEALGQISHGTTKSLLSVSGSGSWGDGINTLSISNAEIERLKAEKARPHQIEATYGKPQAVFDSRVTKWLRYSHSPGSTHYQLRMIGLDREGKVCRKISEFYWD